MIPVPPKDRTNEIGFGADQPTVDAEKRRGAGVRVVGGQFAQMTEAAKAGMLDIGLELRLERDPENEFDKNAVMVFAGQFRIGFINKQDAVWVARALDDEKYVVNAFYKGPSYRPDLEYVKKVQYCFAEVFIEEAR